MTNRYERGRPSLHMLARPAKSSILLLLVLTANIFSIGNKGYLKYPHVESMRNASVLCAHTSIVLYNECEGLRLRYMIHLHCLNILLSTSHLAPHSHRFNWVIGMLPGLGSFAHPKVADWFLTECDVLSTPSLPKDLLPDLDQQFSYYQLNQAKNVYFCRPRPVVVSDELTPGLRDCGVMIMNVLEWMTQHALKKSRPQCYIELSITRGAIHSPCISGFLALFCPGFLAIATADFTLAALIHSLDRTILLVNFTPEAGWTVGVISHLYLKQEPDICESKASGLPHLLNNWFKYLILFFNHPLHGYACTAVNLAPTS